MTGAGAKEFLAPDFIERGAGVLEHVKLVEHDLRVRQGRAYRVEIRPVHVGADRRDRRSLARGQILSEQHRGGRFAAILAQTDHLAVHDIRQHGPEPLPLAA